MRNEVPQENKLATENKEGNDKKEAFVFSEATPEEKAKLAAAEKKVEKACESFARALDSTAPWLTKELSDIYEQLEKIMWVNKYEEIWDSLTEEEKEKLKEKEWKEKSILWCIAYRLLYEKHKDVIPEGLRDILWKMMYELSKYEKVKEKRKKLKDLLRNCASIVSVQSAIQLGGWRTFIPGNLGCHIPY